MDKSKAYSGSWLESVPSNTQGTWTLGHVSYLFYGWTVYRPGIGRQYSKDLGGGDEVMHANALGVGTSFVIVSFDTSGPYLGADVGRMKLDTKSQALAEDSQVCAEVDDHGIGQGENLHHGHALSADRSWVTRNDYPVSWLPSDSRPP